LAEIVFPGEPIERKHEVSVRRALNNLPDLELNFYKAYDNVAARFVTDKL